jgi:hypothetical protein
MRPRSIYDVMAAIGCFAVLATGTAYAANTVFSTDIVDGEVKSVDIGNGEVGSADVKDNSLNTFDVHSFLGVDVVDGSLTGADIGDGTLTGFDIADGAVNSAKTADNSLTGADIDEASLNLPPTTTARFAGQGSVALPNDNASFTAVVTNTLPAGSYGIAATANVVMPAAPDTRNRTTQCELRNHNGAFIGGGRNVGQLGGGVEGTVTLSMNGGVQIPAGGGQVGVYCRHIVPGFAITAVADAQMMIVRLDGFF